MRSLNTGLKALALVSTLTSPAYAKNHESSATQGLTGAEDALTPEARELQKTLERIDQMSQEQRLSFLKRLGPQLLSEVKFVERARAKVSAI